MVRKGVLVMVLATFIAGGAFAKADPNWKERLFNIKSGPTVQNGVLFVDVGTMFGYLISSGFGISGGWEQKFSKNWTGFINVRFGMFDNGSPYWSYLDLGGDIGARYYFFGSALDKLFLGAGVGFIYRQSTRDYSGNKSEATSGGLIIPIRLGWKFILGPGFVIEPNFGYDVGIRIIKPAAGYNGYDDWGGFGIGLRFGWAF